MLESETPAKLEFYHNGSETDMDEQIPNSWVEGHGEHRDLPTIS